MDVGPLFRFTRGGGIASMPSDMMGLHDQYEDTRLLGSRTVYRKVPD